MKLENKIIVITGASSGLGRAISIALAKEGAQLILIGKNLAELEKTDDLIRELNLPNLTTPSLVAMDLTKFEMIPNLAKQLANRFGFIDGLILNAAILGELMPITHYSPKIWQQVIDTNLTANFYLLSSLEFLLNQARQPRIIGVSDQITNSAHAFWGLYNISKLAFERMIETYALEVTKPEFMVNLVKLDSMATKLRKKAVPGLDLTNFPDPYLFTDIFIELNSDSCHYHNQIISI